MKTNKILVIGKNGQLARSFSELFRQQQIEVVFLARPEIDLSAPDQLISQLDSFRPEILINTAAYTDVDGAESDVERARQINGETPGRLAEWSKRNSCQFLHFSTDYVFDGSGESFWSEDSDTGPLNEYGSSKLLGERNISEVGWGYILRTSTVFAPWGNNFVKTMLKLSIKLENLNVVDDQVSCPTYAPHLAQVCFELMQSPLFGDHQGIYHVCPPDKVNRFGMVQEIISKANTLGFPIKVGELGRAKTSDFPTPAQRPLFSAMSSAKFKDQFGIQMPPWRDGVGQCLEKLKELGFPSEL